jgi:subtilisin family serine protease
MNRTPAPLGAFALLASILVVTVVSGRAATAPATHSAPSPENASASEGQNVYLIRLGDPPLAAYSGGVAGLAPTGTRSTGERKLDPRSPAAIAYLDYLAVQQERAIQSIEATLERPVEVHYRYVAGNNGFALSLSPDEAARTGELPEIVFIQEDAEQQLYSDAGPEWVGATALWGGLSGTKGEGIVAGVIDTGINPLNPSFADVGEDGYDHANPLGKRFGVCDPANISPPPGVSPYDPSFPCNDKLIGAWGYTSVNGGSPLDYLGHGSHTAGTLAGNLVLAATVQAPTTSIVRTISGVAPHANIIAYAACCTLSGLTAAIDQTILDGVDVVNYSIGSTTPSAVWEHFDTLGFLNARAAGIFVAVAAGNEGPLADTVGSPADAPWLTSVGASTHHRAMVNFLTGMSGSLDPPADIEGRGFTAAHGPETIVYAGDFGDNNCQTPFPSGTWKKDEIVVCDFDVDAQGNYANPSSYGQFVTDGGAGGLVLANTAAAGLVRLNWPNVLPAVHINAADAAALKAWLASGTGHSATISGASPEVDARNGDITALLSSRGANRALPDILSPNVTAPGIDVIAASGASGDVKWNFGNGTSMASPHVAGSAALLTGIHPEWSPAEIQSALMTAAWPFMVKEDESSPADPFDVGSGRIDAANAANAAIVLDESRANYLAANPDDGGDPKSLNLPSMGNDECEWLCRWTRVVRSTLDVEQEWEISVTAPMTVDISVSPLHFTLAPGSEQIVTIDADLSAVKESGWLFAEIALLPASSAGPGSAPVATPASPEELAAEEAKAAAPPVEVSVPDLPSGATVYSANTIHAPEWDRPQTTGCSISTLGPVRYHRQAIRVDVTGVYAIASSQDYDGYLHLYVNSFDPSNQCANLLAGNDDDALLPGSSGITTTLDAAATYIIVTSAFEAGGEGSFSNAVSGPGQIRLLPAARMPLAVKPKFSNVLSAETPAACAVSQAPLPLFSQRWESGLADWSVGQRDVASPATFLAPDWEVVGTLPDDRPGQAAFVANNPLLGECGIDDQSGVLYLESPDYSMPPAIEPPRLAFDHWVALERGWDGANVSISVNGGPWTLLPSDAYLFNPYNTHLKTAAAGSSNPMAGQQAFSGINAPPDPDGSWGRSLVELSGLVAPGDTVKLRFEMGQDACGGEVGWYVDDLEIYACRSIPAPPTWAATGSLAQGRRDHPAARLDSGRVLVAGGSTASGQVEIYDPATEQWSPTASLNAGRSGHSLTLLDDGRVLAVGGSFYNSQISQTVYLTTTEIYSPATGLWTFSGPLDVGRAEHKAVRMHDGRVIVIGGLADVASTLASAEIFDPATGAWQNAAEPMSQPRDGSHAAILLVDGTVLVAGGNTDNGAGLTLSGSELYDPLSDTWTATLGVMQVARERHAAVRLEDGRVLVAGGRSASGTSLAGAELYDPETQTWSQTANDMPFSIGGAFEAVLLPGGLALVAGGEGAGSDSLATAALYDPVAGLWRAARPLIAKRAGHSLTLLQDSRVLAAGGDSGSPSHNALSSAELYSPFIHVSAGAVGANNGSSWSNAYRELQDALKHADPGDEIWVASGAYRPDYDYAANGFGHTGQRQASFRLRNGVALYGGFAGTESGLDQRKWQAHPSILSGDVDRNDLGSPAYGSGDVVGTNSYHVVDGSNVDGTAILDGFVVTAGLAESGAAKNSGGGLLIVDGSPAVSQVIFSGNVAVQDGPSGGEGGGLFSEGDSDPRLNNLYFLGNAAHHGGAISSRSTIGTALTNTVFSGNMAAAAGGAIATFESDLRVVNSTFSGNSAPSGGAISGSGGRSTIVNSVLWGNSSLEIDAQLGNVTTVSDSVIQGGYSGTNVLNLDPLFLNAAGPDGMPGTVDDDLRLGSASPAIDSAGDTDCPKSDVSGVPRPVDGDADGQAHCDMGAYETAAQIAINPARLNVQLIPGASKATSITVQSAGGLTLDWSLAGLCPADAAVSWLDVAPAGGSLPPGTSTDLTITLDAAGLAVGAYTASLCFSSNDPAFPTLAYPVTMTVYEPRQLFIPALIR